MADPARAEKVPWGKRRQLDWKRCGEIPCYPVLTILDRGDVTVAYPPCRKCVYEAKFKTLKGY